LDFDLRLADHALNGKEQLSIELFFNNAWHQYAGFSNFGDITWFPAHINISPVAGKAFIIRFRAHGLTTENIQQWNVDNIHVYGICNPPSNLAGDAAGLDVNLTWSPPYCYPGHLLEEGFEGSLFPPENWTQVITDTANTWYHSDASTPWGVHSGNWAASLKSDYNHQDEWLIVSDVYINGNLSFWSYGFQGSVHGDHYLVQISENNGATWITLGDLSSLPPYPSSSGYNEWAEPYTFDMSAYSGEVLKIAWHALEENGQGLWYNWAIDDCVIGDKKIALQPEEAGFLGYDIYRSDGGSGNFAKINGSPVNDTAYTDPGLIPGQYDYYVVSVYEECSSFISSDTTTVDVITGFPDNQGVHLKIFPNPATDAVNIISPSPICEITVLNLAGQLVKNSPPVMNNEYVLSLSGIRPGVYILRIQTSKGMNISRLAIVR
jgi:hypothetical protein